MLHVSFYCIADGECIWEGFVCNGIKDCQHGQDEMGCDFSLVQCPEGQFRCESTGQCITEDYVCDGMHILSKYFLIK